MLTPWNEDTMTKHSVPTRRQGSLPAISAFTLLVRVERRHLR
jgi:hypothetical protein